MASYSPEPAIGVKPKELSRISIVATATTVQTGSSPIPQIVPTQDTAMNARPSAFLVEAVGAEHYQKEFRRFFGESNARPAVGRSNGDITRSKSKFELVSKVWTDPFSTPSRLRGRWIWYRRKSRRFRDRRGVQCIQTHGL